MQHKDRFDSLSELFNEAIIIVDQAGVVERSNTKAFDLLGAHIAHRPLDNFLRHPDFQDALDAASTSGKTTDLNYTRMGQVRRDFKIRIAPFENAQIILIIFDITMELSVERIQSEFVANVSHELRSPLTALTGFIETLQTSAREDVEARERFLGIMQSEADRMQRLIDGLLSLSRVEAEEHRAPRDALDLIKVIEDAIAALRFRASGNDMDIVVYNDWPEVDGVPVVNGAADELSEVLHNLIENAIKYGREGSEIAVRISTGRGVDQKFRPDLVRFQIINQGDTIGEEHLSRLTERFYRVDKGRSRNMGGSGLGLAIVKHIVNRHRGRLRITSSDGESCFSITLPCVMRS
jgi:two-component system phosphate regulon sensor histidine kinase PhoR